MTEFSTEQLSGEDQLACWLALMDQQLIPTRMRPVATDGFPASARTLAWDELQVSVMAFPSLTVSRSQKLIRKSDPEAYQINLVLDGAAMIAQAGREAELGVGAFALYDTSRPFEGRRSCDHVGRTVTAQLSRTLLPLPANEVDRLPAIPFDARNGMGAAFARWLVDLTERAHEFTPADAPTLTAVTVELLSAVLASTTGTAELLTPEARRRALRMQVNGFIEQRLGDPALSPKTVAEAHNISLRTLQQLFAARQVTPAAWIRQRRLEHCRRDLANPRLSRRPIHAIAARWGFVDAAHFSRRFRATYGLTPSDYRHDALLREQPGSLRA